MLQKETVLAYSDFLKPFNLYTNASDVQLGATLVQEEKPIGFYTYKLDASQIKLQYKRKRAVGNSRMVPSI